MFGVVIATTAQADAPADNVFLQCDGEIRTRQLAFQFGALETEELVAASRGLQIESAMRAVRGSSTTRLARCCSALASASCPT